MSGPVPATSEALLNAANSLTDPVSLEPLSTCVRLTMCDHAMNEKTVLNLIQRHRPCPMCRRGIHGYRQDMLIQSIVQALKESNAERVLLLLQDPITKQPLTPDCVRIITPDRFCSHVMEENTAITHFACPTCLLEHPELQHPDRIYSAKITGWSRDFVLRSFITALHPLDAQKITELAHKMFPEQS